MLVCYKNSIKYPDQDFDTEKSLYFPCIHQKKDPPPEEEKLSLATIPPLMKDALAIMKSFKGLHLNLRDVMAGLEKYGLTVQAIPHYFRPSVLSPKQNQIIDEILDPTVKLYMLEGDQRTGKSSIVKIAIDEFVLTRDPKFTKIDMMAGKGKQCANLLGDLLRDPLFTNNLIVSQFNTRATYWNGSFIQTHETTVADIKGGDSHIIWIDELDVAIKQDPKAVFRALMVLRARTAGDFKIILSANMDKGIYLALREELQKSDWQGVGVKFNTLCATDVPHIKLAGNDQLLAKIGRVIVGEGQVGMALENRPDSSGDIFPVHTLKMLMEEYELFITQIKDEIPDYTILSIDPSLTGHPLGWIIIGYVQNTWYEIASGEFQFGDGTNNTWSLEKIENWLLDMKRLHKFKCVVCESNTLGPVLEVFARGYGIRWVHQDFQGDNTEESRSVFLSVVSCVLEDHAFLFKNNQIYFQFTQYDPENLKKEGKYKGDLADAVIHGIYYCARGRQYLRARTPQQNSGAYSFVEKENPR